MMKTKEDSTRNGRQARRREREKAWLKEHGWGSWEALHTALMRGEVLVIFRLINSKNAAKGK